MRLHAAGPQEAKNSLRKESSTGADHVTQGAAFLLISALRIEFNSHFCNSPKRFGEMKPHPHTDYQCSIFTVQYMCV